ncbi:MAG: hypothetical protein HQK51_18960 [Oligoflexia bacterium]|nr:hypothetical protein [Oligoflexia bacterium]
MSNFSNIECKNWIPISNSIYKNFYRKYDSSAMSVLFKIISRIHNYKGKTYTKFPSLTDACTYFDISKKPLLRELELLQKADLIEYVYYRHSRLEIELKFERPHTDFTKLPVDLIREAQKIDLTTNAFSLYMFLIYKFSRPHEKEGSLALNLNYLGKVIQTTSRTAKSALQSLMGHGLINCVFAKFQTQDPCIITPLFLSSKNKQLEQNKTEKIQAPNNKHVENKPLTIKKASIAITIQEQNITKPKLSNNNTNEPQNKTLTDLKRVLKRHNHELSDAPLIIKFLTDTPVGLDKKPIKSIPAVWEKDIQSELKILHFRFSEWKHQQLKEENQQFLKEQATKEADLFSEILVSTNKENFSAPVIEIDRSKVKFNFENNTLIDSYNTMTKMNNFSNQMNKFSNCPSFFKNNLNNFSNNLINLNTRNINNHIKGAYAYIENINHQSFQKTNEQIAMVNSDCDSINFSTEELAAIKQYEQDKNSVRFLKVKDFTKRYLDIGVELLRVGKKINLENISLLYAEKNKASRGYKTA